MIPHLVNGSAHLDITTTKSRPKVVNTDLGLLLSNTVYPALFDRLESVFPEFGFDRRGEQVVATRWPHDFPLAVEHPHPDRLFVYRNTCFGVMCHGHNIVPFLNLINGGRTPRGEDFINSVRRLCELAGVAYPERKRTQEEIQQSELWETRRAALTVVLDICQRVLWGSSPEAQEARLYLNGRGLTDEDIRNLGLGLYPTIGSIKTELKKLGYDHRFIQAAKDAAVVWGKLTGFIIVPWHDASGQILTLYGRWRQRNPPLKKDLSAWQRDRDNAFAIWEKLSEEQRVASPWVEPSVPKTIAMPGQGTKSDPLFFDRVRCAGHDLVVGVEGVFDGALLQCRGDNRVIAYVGAQFTHGQVESLVRYQIKQVILVPDPDGGGDSGAESSVKNLLKAGIRVYVADRLPDGLDPDEFLNREGIDGWRQHIANPTPGAVWLALRKLDGITPQSPEIERRAKVEALAAFVSSVADPIDKEGVIKAIAKRTAFGVKDVRVLLGGKSRKRSEPSGSGDGQTDEEQGKNGCDGLIIISTAEKGVNDQAVEMIASDPNLFALGHKLATVVQGGDGPRGIEYLDGTPPRLAPIALATLRERMAASAAWMTINKEGGKALAHPPDWSVKAVMERGYWPGVRRIVGIIEAPTIRPDGSILDTPGYDQATGLFFSPTGDFKLIPEYPTPEQIKAAVDRLFGLVVDFPFIDNNHKAAWLAALLTVLARSAIDGPVPLFAFDGNSPGTGKSMLADLIAVICTSRRMPRTIWPHGRDADEEMRKRITSLLLAAERFTLLDNIAWPHALGGAPLDALLTSSTWKDRLLGRSETTGELPNRMTCFASGNNIQFGTDIIRRVITSRLVSPVEDPENRAGFKYPNLIEHARANRSRYLADGLTIVRGYFAADLPGPVKDLGSYEAWCRVVVGAVQWATGFDPLEPRELVKASDTGGQNRRNLFSGLMALPGIKTGLTAGEIRKAVAPGKDEPSAYPTMHDALMEFSRKGEFPSTREIGNLLRGIKDRVIEGYRLEAGEDTHKKVARWSLVPVAGSSGVERGIVTAPPRTKENSPTQDARTHMSRLEPSAHHPAEPRLTPQIEYDDERELAEERAAIQECEG